MNKLKFRLLGTNEIEVRVGMVKPNGVSLLLYKNARCDMSILDETVGAENWQRKHYDCKNNLYCSVGIKCGDSWVWKDDCGSESNQDKEKGEASDAFKRACVNWGIGRELYTAPFIWISPPQCTIKDNKRCFDKFSVEHIAYDGGRISELRILKLGEYGKSDTVVYEYPKSAAVPPRQVPKSEQAPPRQVQGLKCPKCGEPIVSITTKSGVLLSPKAIYSNWGMCFECYKKSKEQKND